MNRDEQIGRMILEASTGMHGDIARDLAQAWCNLAEKKQGMQSRLESLEKGAVQMHDEIINLRVNEDSAGAPYTNWREAYLWGHRDARHAAAELVTAMQAQGNTND